MHSIENIEEGNKLLSKFVNFPLDASKYMATKGIGFHNYWNWPMLIVDKIDKTELDGLTFSVDICRGHSEINVYGNTTINNVCFQSGTSLVFYEHSDRQMATFYATVMFVEWYYKNKK